MNKTFISQSLLYHVFFLHFTLLIPIFCLNNGFNPKYHHQPLSNRSSVLHLLNDNFFEKNPVITKIVSQSSDQPTQDNTNFIQKLFDDQKFFTSLLESVSKVFQNDWILNLSIQVQKVYLKIILTTVNLDVIDKIGNDQLLQILRRLLQNDSIAEEFFRARKIDFQSHYFQKFINSYYPEETRNLNFSKLTTKDKTNLLLLAFKKENQLNLQKSSEIGKDNKKKLS